MATSFSSPRVTFIITSEKSHEITFERKLCYYGNTSFKSSISNEMNEATLIINLDHILRRKSWEVKNIWIYLYNETPACNSPFLLSFLRIERLIRKKSTNFLWWWFSRYGIFELPMIMTSYCDAIISHFLITFRNLQNLRN